MKLSNKKLTNQYKFFQAFLFLLVLAVIIWFINVPQIVRSNHIETIIGIIIFYIIAEYILYLRKYYLINYSDENGRIEIEFSRKKHKISLLYENLEKFEIRTTGLRKELIIFEKIKEGIKEHLPISLTALTNDEVKKIVNSLTKILENNKKNK